MRSKIYRLLTIALISILLLSSCATSGYSNRIQLSKYKEEISFHTRDQNAYLEDELKSIKNYANGTEEKSRPLPVTLTWTDSMTVSSDSYEVCLSLNKDFSDGKIYTTDKTSIDIYNLYAGTEYYWSVTSYAGDRATGYAAGKFTTADAPRNLYVDGVTNVRDMGGYKTEDGGTVRQGLIYRTAKLNKNSTQTVIPLITEAGIDTMVNEMGIKTELDLRRVDTNEIGKLTSSVLGDNVAYYNCPMVGTFPIFTQRSFEGIKQAFDVLSEESNYPLFYHCSIGTDRTGLIAVLIYNLLGVSEDDIYRDYMFSNFGNISSPRLVSQCQVYFRALDDYEGSNYREKTTNFLLSIGVTRQQMDNIVSILKEK